MNIHVCNSNIKNALEKIFAAGGIRTPTWGLEVFLSPTLLPLDQSIDSLTHLIVRGCTYYSRQVGANRNI